MSNKNISTDVYDTISEAIDYLQESYKGNSLTDIYFVVDYSSGELAIYDDEQNIVSQKIISSWSGLEEQQIVRELRCAVENLDEENKFDKLDVFKPFSINLSDEDFVIIEELLLIDDDSIVRLEDDFMKRMDQEFDDFLDRLMKE